MKLTVSEAVARLEQSKLKEVIADVLSVTNPEKIEIVNVINLNDKTYLLEFEYPCDAEDNIGQDIVKTLQEGIINSAPAQLGNVVVSDPPFGMFCCIILLESRIYASEINKTALLSKNIGFVFHSQKQKIHCT